MQRPSLCILTLSLIAVGCSKPAPETSPKAEDAPGPAIENAQVKNLVAKKEATAKPEAPAKPDKVALAAEARKNGIGGLPVGERFTAFQIINAVSGDEYCQVCQYGSSPKIMATGTIDDPAFHEDLKNIDALLAKYGEDKVKAFAVIAAAEGDHLVTPMTEREALQARAKELATKLELTYPLVLPAPAGDKRNEIFEDHYNIKSSRTLMFADGRNKVQYVAVAPENLGALNDSITKTIGG